MCDFRFLAYFEEKQKSTINEFYCPTTPLKRFHPKKESSRITVVQIRNWEKVK